MRGAQTSRSRQEGFTLVEMLVVVLIAGIIAAAILGVYLSVFRTTADQSARMQNQDSARTAVYSMSRLIRSACSSESNLTSLSDSLVIASAQELVFFADIDGDNEAERVRLYLDANSLRMQSAEPDIEDSPPSYPAGYDSDGIVIMDGVRNGAGAIFTYYGCDETSTSLYTIANPNSETLRRSVVAVDITLKVNERPEIAKGDVDLTTRVQIRQRYDGGLNGS